LSSSDANRLSVTRIDVHSGRETDFAAWAAAFEAILIRKNYGRADMIRDEALPLRFYAVRHWNSAAAARQCHGDAEVQGLAASLYQLASVTHLVNGVQSAGPQLRTAGDRRASGGADRRSGFDRRQQAGGNAAGVERRRGQDRRIASRRQRQRPEHTDLIDAARRARAFAEAAFSHFKVGAALETRDGTVITGCNVENATYGLTVCAERVAMFKAISEGHRTFTRIAVVADTEAPTPPCGACRQILWEFGGDLEVQLANLTAHTGTHRLRDLLPLPFDKRLL
jgi:cytidine deaminase